MNKKSIAVICYNIRDFSKNSVSYNRYLYLCKSFDVYLVSQTYSSHETENQAKRVRHCPGRAWYLDRIFYPIWAAIYVSIINRKKRIDFVYTPYHNLALVAGFLLKKMGFNWVADIYDDPGKTLNDSKYVQLTTLEYYFFYVIYVIARSCLKHADLIICAMVPTILAKYNVDKGKVLAITNGINVKLTKRENPGIGKDDFKIIYVGEMNEARGTDVILSTVAYLKEKITNFKCILVGEANAVLISTINQMGLSQYITVSGMIEHEKTLDFISESDVCLCPLLNDGDYPYTYPIKIFEYMALGKVIVATNLTGIRSIIKDGYNGLLVTAGDPKDMGDAILKLYQNREMIKQMGDNNLKDIDKYDWENINSKVHSRILKLIR